MLEYILSDTHALQVFHPHSQKEAFTMKRSYFTRFVFFVGSVALLTCDLSSNCSVKLLRQSY